ncbi:YncE family protein [Pedobacter sp. ASV12]|uniref:YncE family protein n=1 Tax=Pedobacter sp. ASV12 TaxID=2795120 RepID=UPI0018EB4B08|nr:DUF5074 domain-containing protein [Pedobacter sp. ASV12]
MKTIDNKPFKTIVLAFLWGILLTSSCKKDRTPAPIPKVPEIAGTKGIYMLCEGLWGMNNSAISYYDIATNTVEKDMYKKVNKTDLGETANDLKAYGSKMYCVVAGNQGEARSFVDIIDIATCKSLKRISFNSANDGYMPRFVTFYKNKAYVSRYDGKISRIDTTSLAVDGELQLMNGSNKAEGLEELTVANGKLYVTNSSHPFYSNGLKTKVTVIDLASFTKVKDIEVGNNPVRIGAAGNGDLYVITWNDYIIFNNPSLVRINSTTDAVVQTESYDLGAINIVKDQAWVSQDVYTNPTVKGINLATGKLGNSLISDGTKITTPYGLTVNGFDQSVAVADAMNYNSSAGKAYIFGKDGKLQYSFATAALPQHAVFNYSYK